MLWIVKVVNLRKYIDVVLFIYKLYTYKCDSYYLFLLFIGVRLSEFYLIHSYRN